MQIAGKDLQRGVDCRSWTGPLSTIPLCWQDPSDGNSLVANPSLLDPMALGNTYPPWRHFSSWIHPSRCNSVTVGNRDGVSEKSLVIGLDLLWSLPHDGKSQKP